MCKCQRKIPITSCKCTLHIMQMFSILLFFYYIKIVFFIPDTDSQCWKHKHEPANMYIVTREKRKIIYRMPMKTVKSYSLNIFKLP